VISAAKVDRAALVRRALIELVAANGFRGTSMSAVAERAGVATGTAYVHYGSKDDLVLAAYREVKAELGIAALAAVDATTPPDMRFRQLWHATYNHLATDPVRARFLVQVQASPYATQAHEAALGDDELMQAPILQDVVAMLIELPLTVLWDISLGPAIRLAASPNKPLSKAELQRVAEACWRAASSA